MAKKKPDSKLEEFDNLDEIEYEQRREELGEKEDKPQERKTSIIGRALRMIKLKRDESMEKIRKFSMQRSVEQASSSHSVGKRKQSKGKSEDYVVNIKSKNIARAGFD